MLFWLNNVFAIILLGLALLTPILANQQHPPIDSSSWESISPAQKLNTIKDWVEKSGDRIRYAHKARMEFASSAYYHAKLLNNQELKTGAMLSLAELNFNAGRFDIAMLYFDSLKVFAEIQNDLQLLIKSENYIAAIHRHRGEIFDALGMLYEAYENAQKNNYRKLIALSANNLAIIYRNMGEFNSSLAYYQEANNMALEEADTNLIITALAGLGHYHWFTKNTDSAFVYYQNAMEIARKTRDMEHIASLNNNLGNIFRAREKYDTALELYSEALNLLEEINVVGLKAVILRNIGLVYQSMHNYNLAIDYIEQSLIITHEIGTISIVRDNYLSLSQIYNALGNTKLAYEHLVRYTDFNQQIYNDQLLNRISYFNEKLYNAQRTEEIYKFRLHRNLYILIIVFIILLSLIIVSMLLFRRAKERRIQLDRIKNTLQDKIITEKALRQSEENYQTLIKTLNEGLIVLDRNNIIEFVNVKAQKILGSSPQDNLRNQPFEKFLLTPEDEKLFHEKVELQKMGISDQYELKMKNTSDDVLWAHISSAPILDEHLKSKGSVALISDITEKKKSEQTYNELTSNLNQKIKQLNCLYDISDVSGVPGITFEEIIEKSLEIIPVGLRYSHDIGVQIIFDNKVYASKNYRDTEWSYSVPIKVQKKKLGLIKVAYVEEKPNINKDPFHFNEKILLKNISEKFGKIIESKNLERVIRQNQQKLQEIQHIAKIGDWEKSLVKETCIFSDNFFEIADISPERRKFFDYSRFLEILHPDDREIFLNFENKLITGDNLLNITANYRIITNGGTIKYIFSSGKLIHEELGSKIACVFTVQDITEQQYTQELKHHAELALKTSEAKQQVVANLSYEMRTPITGILGMTDFLLESNLNDHQMELAKTIKESSFGLLSSINNILDLQRIETGKIKLNNAVFGFSQLKNKIISLFTALTRNKEIDLVFHIHPDLPESIISDQERLYQVITSLISIVTENTAKKGTITIELKPESLKENNLFIAVEVLDNFSNIDIDEVKQILNPEDGFDDLLMLKKDNMSISLVIAKKLVEMLEGNITVKKNITSGSTFYFNFFATIAESDVYNGNEAPTNESILKALKGLRVLCVEDQKINQKVISLMLAQANCLVTIANNGKEAISILESQSFDVILLDMIMPVMNGIETLKKITQESTDFPPVIGLSANVMDDDKEIYFKAGLNDFISKPINAQELYLKIHKWCNPSETKKARTSRK
jgi:PAS domain S-box-containing protein